VIFLQRKDEMRAAARESLSASHLSNELIALPDALELLIGNVASEAHCQDWCTKGNRAMRTLVGGRAGGAQ
jgi:hypothetical protein